MTCTYADDDVIHIGDARYGAAELCAHMTDMTRTKKVRVDNRTARASSGQAKSWWQCTGEAGHSCRPTSQSCCKEAIEMIDGELNVTPDEMYEKIKIYASHLRLHARD